MKFLILITTLTLLFSGCGSSKKMVVAEKKALPVWYMNPPISNASDLYAVGEGQSREGAISDALSMMASTLSVSISSDFNSKSVVKEGRVNSSQATYINKVQSRVEKIRISNYELQHSQSIGYKKYIVLVKSNKQKLFSSMKQELDQKFYLIDERKKSLINLNAIKKASKYRTFVDELSSVENSLIVMHVLNNSFNGQEYLEKSQAVESEFQTILSNLTFSISSNDVASNLKSTISKGLSANKLRLKNSSGRNHFNIHLNSHINRANSYGFTLARSSIDITIKDYRGSVIGSNKLNIVGQSTSGFAQARENVAYKLNEMIKKDGISKVIGLKI